MKKGQLPSRFTLEKRAKKEVKEVMSQNPIHGEREMLSVNLRFNFLHFLLDEVHQSK
jgi:hypothetical protein